MTAMNLSLPEPLKDFVGRRTAEAGYGTSGEYVRELVCLERNRFYWRCLLLEGVEPPVSGEAGGAYSGSLRDRIRRRLPAADA